EFVGYLTLGEVFIEPEMEDSPFSFRAGLDQRLERVEVLDQFHPIVDVAEGVESGSSIDSHLGFEGIGAVSTTQRRGLGDIVFGEAGFDGHFFDRGGAAETLGQFLVGPTTHDRDVFEAPGYSGGPAGIPEVPLDLAGDGRNREADEATAVFGVVPIDGVDQTQEGDLSEVLGFDPAMGIAVGQMEGERPVQVEELAPGPIFRHTTK